jgi:hypothetical protein
MTEYNPTVSEPNNDFSIMLLKFYKKCVVHFRALYTITCLLPSWRLWNTIKNETSAEYPLTIRYRITDRNGDGESEADSLSQPLFDDESSSVTDQIIFDDIQGPLGTLLTRVTYRKECKFFVKSERRSGARFPVRRKYQSLYGLEDNKYFQPQQRKRSSSLPEKASGFDQWRLRHLASSFLSRAWREETQSTPRSPLTYIGAETSYAAEGIIQENLDGKVRNGNPSAANAISKAIRAASVKLFGSDYVHDDLGISSADRSRGRKRQTVVREAGPRSRSNSSTRSNGSSGRGSSPASLRNISIAPKEFDPLVPTLRHNYSSPDLQDWSNVQARVSSRHSSPTIPDNQTPLNTNNSHSHQHPFLMSNNTGFQRNSILLPSHPYQENHQYQNPAPLLSHGLFRMVQSNADPHVLHSHYTDLSDPPDLYAPLHEEQVPPTPEDMNPTDPELVPHEQELRFDGDLYTPRWVRGHGNKREGWCGICKPGRWLVLKNSAFWYDKSFTHGISAATGSAFQEPQETRRMDGNPDVWEGLCRSCNDWVALVSSKKGTTWFRHAYKVTGIRKLKPVVTY